MKRTPLTRRARLRRRTQLRSGGSIRRRFRPGWFKARRFCEGRANGLCEANTPACPPGRHRGAHAHHIILRSQGGSDDPSNLLFVCSAAHRWIHDHPAESYVRGWLRRAEAS